jgi:hypothetical protein
MSESDARLRAFFAKDEPPMRDLAFEWRVEARLLRRRIARAAVDRVAPLAAAVAVGWAAAPTLAPYVREIATGLGTWLLLGVVVASIGSSIWALRRRPL